ncbi:MAG: CAP domain-containing protein, partial [Anaeromyxobacteraceae bacterium]
MARRHSEQMRAAGTVAHVLPGGGDLASRLAAARIGYSKAFENVASGATSLDAHAATEASPAHLG